MFGRGKRLPAEVRRLRLEPNDILVLKCEGRITEDMAATLKRKVEDRVPEHRCLVLDSDAELSVLTPFGPDAVPDGVLTFHDQLTEAEVAEAKERFLRAHGEPPRVMS